MRSDRRGRAGGVKLTILGSRVTRMGCLDRLFADGALFPMSCSVSFLRVGKEPESVKERPDMVVPGWQESIPGGDGRRQ